MQTATYQLRIPRPSEQRIPELSNFLKASTLLGMLGLSLWTNQALLNSLDISREGVRPLFQAIPAAGIILVSAVLNAMLLSGVGAIAHEGIHRVLCRNRLLNDLAGGLLSALVVFLPFYANRKFHLDHHGDTHEHGIDPEEKLHSHGFWIAFLFGGPIAIYQHYKIVFGFLTDRGPKRRTRMGEALKDLSFVSAAAVFYFVLLPAAGMSLFFTILPMFAVGPLVYSFRAVCDHYAVPDVAASTDYLKGQCPHLDRPSRFRVVDSWVILTNPLMDWLWSHLNYQQVHHRYPFLSHVYLPEIYEATKDYQPYLVAPGYLACLRIIHPRPYYTRPEEMASHFQLPIHPEPVALRLTMAGEPEAGGQLEAGT
jgi:fatty acid desaturase